MSKTSDVLVSLTDLMPTILDFLDLPVPETVQGNSLRDLLDADPANDRPRPYVYGEHNSHGPARAEHYPTRMAFDGRFYYLRNLLPEKDYLLPADMRAKEPWGNHAYSATVEAAESHPLPYRLLRQLEHGRPAEELYDILNDPACTHNLAGSDQYLDVQRQLSAALDDWRNRTGDLADDPLDIPTRQPTKNP